MIEPRLAELRRRIAGLSQRVAAVEGRWVYTCDCLDDEGQGICLCEDQPVTIASLIERVRSLLPEDDTCSKTRTQVDVGPVGTGKTRRLIHKAADEGLYMVVPTHADAYRVSQEARSLGLDMLFPMTFDEFLAGSFGPGVTGIVVDQADRLIQRLAGSVPVRAIALRSELPVQEKE